MPQADFILLHPPSVYDFRRKAILYGPVSDLIPSSPVFEMYPLGFLTITNYLEERGITVRVINLALRMMNDRRFDVTKFISRLRPKAFGIDLHWLPHAHGALEIAAIVKSSHPEIPVICGGLSASYFHEELIDYPQIDFVIRGDAVEPALYELLLQIGTSHDYGHVANLTWKERDKLRINPLCCIPDNYDYVNINPMRMVRMVLRYRDLQSVLPFNGWWQNPITAVFDVKGCAHQCQTCGGSKSAYESTVRRKQPVFRSPDNLIENIMDIASISRGPIFLVGDLHQAGEDYIRETLERLKATKVRNEIVFELFAMPNAGFLKAIDGAVKTWSLELSPESHDAAIRQRQDSSVNYSNSEMEQIIHEALSLRCNRLDIFFMIGLEGQSSSSVNDTIHYCGRLFAKFDRRLSCFVSPLGPFLDPGSICFEKPQESGYQLFAHTLEEHRRRLLNTSWRHILNYETDSMSRGDLVTATYSAAEQLNQLKLDHGRISKKRSLMISKRIAKARELEAQLSKSELGQLDERATSLLLGEINEFSVSTVCDKRELFWRRHLMNFRWGKILRQLCLTHHRHNESNVISSTTH